MAEWLYIFALKTVFPSGAKQRASSTFELVTDKKLTAQDKLKYADLFELILEKEI